MSAFIKPPRGCIYLVFETCPGGMRFLTVVRPSPSRRKVNVKAKVLPLRKTKGAHRLMVYCVPTQRTAEAIELYVDAILSITNRLAERFRARLQPLVGMPATPELHREIRDRVMAELPQPCEVWL